ncbi:MAG: hypothetical protein ACO1TE_18620 [Prosthecobacter sp.]
MLLLASNKEVLESLQALLTCVALFFGGGFFVYKYLVGTMYVNMTLGIRAERQPLDDTCDHLAVAATFEKGAMDSIFLLDIQGRAIPRVDGEFVEAQAIDFEICGFGPAAENAAGKIQWKGKAKRGGLAITPTEKTEFGGYAQIHQNTVYRIEVVAIGNRRLHKTYTGHHAQWRASLISLPPKAEKT